ncbi:MAG: hypothetical protein Q8N17_24685 [Burkholderiaceae bacterium]|nr:hypothetical protein [Burkholderiaceae bacterium]
MRSQNAAFARTKQSRRKSRIPGESTRRPRAPVIPEPTLSGAGCKLRGALRKEKISAELAPSLTEDELVDDLGFSREDAQRFVALLAKQSDGHPQIAQPPDTTAPVGHGIAMPPLSRQVLELMSPVSAKTPPHDAAKGASAPKNPAEQDFELQVRHLLESLNEDPAPLLKHLRHVTGGLPQSPEEWRKLQDSDAHIEYLFQITAVLDHLKWPDTPPKDPPQGDEEWMEQVRRDFRSQPPADTWHAYRPGVKIMLPAEAFEPEPPVENISKTFHSCLPVVITFPGADQGRMLCSIAPVYSEKGNVSSATVSVSRDMGAPHEMRVHMPMGDVSTVVTILRSGEIHTTEPMAPNSGNFPDKFVSARLLWLGESLIIDAFPGPIDVLDGSEKT